MGQKVGSKTVTVYGYARVSTQGQDLKDQVEQLIKNGVEPDNIFQEKFTGTTSKRPQFEALQSKLAGGDELIVAKLDRLGRKTSDVISFLDKCSNENITVNVLNMGRLDNSPGGRLMRNVRRLMRNVISSFAEYERDMIVSRTQEGKAYAKQHNPHYREGRPKRRITDRYQAIYEYSLKHSIKETALATGVSESTVKRIRRQINHLNLLFRKDQTTCKVTQPQVH